MRRTLSLTIVPLAIGHVLAAQGTLAARVARAPDGVVHVQYDARPGACGDGRDVVGYKKAMFARDFQGIGEWNGTRCVPGPVRVSMKKTGAEITRLRTQVGGGWPAEDERVTDLGVVASTDASAYFLSLVPQLERSGERERDRLMLPAVLADDPAIIGPLLALARDAGRADRTRRAAIQWVGLLGDASVVPSLVSFAREGGTIRPEGDPGDGGDAAAGRKGLASSALAALSFLDGSAGVPALIDLARTGSSGTRHGAVFWLGQSGDPRALRTLHEVIENGREEQRVRAHAIFSLGQASHSVPAERDWLRSAFSRLDSDRLKEAVIQAAGEDESDRGQWLLQRARDARESSRLRRNALFWAGQHESTPTADLVAFYRDATEPPLREHAIFVLSQRRDEPATEALLRIARDDGDSRSRGRALFWLAQKHDSRVTKLIGDLLVR
jgi:HEAT repeat protein